jgi:hypothetical protein
MNALLILISFLLLFYGIVCLTSPEFARSYYLKYFRLKEPENWYDRLFYLKAPPHLLLFRLIGMISIGCSLLLLSIVYYNA